VELSRCELKIDAKRTCAISRQWETVNRCHGSERSWSDRIWSAAVERSRIRMEIEAANGNLNKMPAQRVSKDRKCSL
jgi:hypothetical protein